jgi:hypothetical protein
VLRLFSYSLFLSARILQGRHSQELDLKLITGLAVVGSLEVAK